MTACQRFVKRACFARGIYKIIDMGYNAAVSPIYVGGTLVTLPHDTPLKKAAGLLRIILLLKITGQTLAIKGPVIFSCF